MKVIWRLEHATVRDIYEALRAERTIAYTTVMTMVRVLEEKGHVTKSSSSDRAFVYTSARPRHQVMGAMVRDFVDRVFDGAPDSLLLHLAKDNKLTPRQRRIVQKLVDEIEE